MNSPLNYFGGKSLLAKKIIPLIPEHTCYCEPFCGAAWIFFRKDPSRVEVLNDRDFNIANLFRVIQHHPEEFLRQFKNAIISRKIFELEKKKDDETLTDIQRAVKTFYLLKNAFAGHPTNQNFGSGAKGNPNLNLLNLEEIILQVHWRLARVWIECLDYTDCIKRYDRPETFFYIDPPYYRIKAYKYNFEPEDFGKMAEILAAIAGKFIMSHNDEKEVRRVFKDFSIRTVSTKYSAMNARKTGGRRGQERKEILISNI